MAMGLSVASCGPVVFQMESPFVVAIAIARLVKFSIQAATTRFTRSICRGSGKQRTMNLKSQILYVSNQHLAKQSFFLLLFYLRPT